MGSGGALGAGVESLKSLKSELFLSAVDIGTVLDGFGSFVDFSSDLVDGVDELGSGGLLLLELLVVILMLQEDIEYSSALLLCLLLVSLNTN